MEWCTFCESPTPDPVLHNLEHDLEEAEQAIINGEYIGYENMRSLYDGAERCREAIAQYKAQRSEGKR